MELQTSQRPDRQSSHHMYDSTTYRDRSFYGTRQELEYIKALGTGKHSKCDIIRGELLARYVRISMKRADWGPINIRLVMRVACEMLWEEIDNACFGDRDAAGEWERVHRAAVKHFRLYDKK